MWTLYEMVNGNWCLSYTGPTGDRCKAVAKEIVNGDLTANAHKHEFLIRDHQGKDWVRSAYTERWRMKWEWAGKQELDAWIARGE